MANQKTDTQVRKEAVDRILLALAGNKGVAASDYSKLDKDIFTQRIIDSLDKVGEKPLDTGFVYDDVLSPNKPHSPFLGDGYYGSNNASKAPVDDGFLSELASYTASQTPQTQPAESEAPAQAAQSARAGFVPNTTLPVGVSYAGGLTYPPTDEYGINRARRRRTPIEQALAAAKDSFDYISGLDDKAYLGKTLEVLNKYDKTRMEEDPEGYQADMNRAKLLSQKAANESDPTKKAILGREIKKLLPVETQGLSDEAAADFFTSSLDEKVKLEIIKGYNKLQQIEATNNNKITLQDMKNMSAKEINDATNQTKWDIASLKAEYDKAIADGNNERAMQVAQLMADKDITLKNLQTAADLKKTEVQQEHADWRAKYGQDAATERAYVSANAKVDSARLAANKGAMSDEMLRKNWTSIKKNFEENQADIENVLAILNERELFGPVTGRLLELGQGDPEDRRMLGYVRGELTRLVQERLQQVRDAAGTGRAADTEKEAERVLGYLGSSSTIDQYVLIGAIEQFMRAADKAMRIKEEYLFSTASQNNAQTQPKDGTVYVDQSGNRYVLKNGGK